ncbi:MAG TPA: hypothetical protein VIM70_12285 [Clostridium sp.]|uniref:hypothetical protein n=1 Tax=Clostridium sp. TaxID=1506 RepID=UPI002F95968B
MNINDNIDAFGYRYINCSKVSTMQRSEIRNKIKIGARLNVTYTKDKNIYSKEVVITKWFKNAVVGEDIVISLIDIIKVETNTKEFKNPNINNKKQIKSKYNYSYLIKLNIRQLESELLKLNLNDKDKKTIKRVVDFKNSRRLRRNLNHIVLRPNNNVSKK